MASGQAVDDEDAAVEALKRFGLSTYEARVFVALQKLEAGSASEVAEIADVPRSQVYGATDELESRGLIDVQQGTPTRYRPVGTEEARTRLYEELRSTGDAAFSYLDGVRGEEANREGRGEAIWTVEGGENVTARCVSLVGEADTSVLYATGDPGAIDPLGDAFHGALGRGVAVTVASAEQPVLDAAREVIDGADTRLVPRDRDPGVSTGQVLLVDRDTVLLSVCPTEAMPHVSEETAFWSTETGFATVLVAILREWFGEVSVA